MLRCVGCKYNNDCIKVVRVEMENCTEYYPLTNADRIRAMTDEELAKWIAARSTDPQRRGWPEWVQCWLNWLRQEVDDEGE